MINLDIYRKDKLSWNLASYHEMHSDEYGKHDRNEKVRYAILISLQYDLQTSDETLIRYLFEQEIIARENDGFQGIGNALWLSAYLLANYKNPSDIPLFYRAKFANFDTGCGFDREFMYLALRDKTEEYVLSKYPDLYDDIEGGFSSLALAENLDNWWENLSKRFPTKESDEPLMELYERNVYFENLKAAKSYLEDWKASEPESEQKNSTLKYAYIELGEFSDAIDILKKELETKETNWDKACCNRDLLKLYTKIGASAEGIDVIKAIDEEFSQFDDWRQLGLGRMTVHEAFEYALVVKDLEVAKTAFKYAHAWFKKMNNIALVGLQAGWKAADKCGFSVQAKKYQKLAKQEQQRIDRM